MSTPHKPRADSRLKTLPEERQAAIIELMRSKSHTEVRKELANDGLVTSEAALSNFWSWWHLQQQFARAEDFSREMVDLLKTDQPALSEEALNSYGQRVFQTRALQMEAADPELAAEIWGQMQKLSLQAQSLKLDRAKFQRETCSLFLKWSEDQRAREIAANNAMPQGEKIEALGQLMFADVWTSDAAATGAK